MTAVGTGAPHRPRRYLVLHGLDNHRPVGHWHRYLVEDLRSAGELVVYPQLPGAQSPRLAEWLDLLEAELAMLGDPAATERVVVGHSLGAVLWLHAAARGLVRPPVDRVLLVAPPGYAETREHIHGFELPATLSAEDVAAASRQTRLACSPEDPWSAAGQVAEYGRPLGLDVDELPGAGHVTMDDGYGRWPAVLAWARDGATRLTP